MHSDKVLKDINFVEMQSDLKRQLFKCSVEERQEILHILKMDCSFLRDHNIMDYSLLLAIEDKSDEPQRYSLNSENDYNHDSRNRLDNQHLGIIDYL